ncbi:hypothetical protein TrST_g2328 [Triparma strigata]|uniref:Ig-like domain-containing protein n=1 Tax=Triparma strigata TaxID=1606541 RepID=A0A9W6ZXE5_9STRA|nr:hypothetical protein TrST_g2328 [Triparma strigata]
MPRYTSINSQCDTLVNWCQPTQQADKMRSSIISFLTTLLPPVVLSGPTPQKTYLATSPINLTVLLPPSSSSSSSITSCLNALTKKSLQTPQKGALQQHQHAPQHVIRYVHLEYINNSPTIKTLVSNIEVLIKFDEHSSSSSSSNSSSSRDSPRNNNATTSSSLNTLIELSNLTIGRNSMLKKVIILTQCFLLNEANRFTGFVDVFKEGGFGYDIVCLMCLAVFCREGEIESVGDGFQEVLRVWSGHDWRGEGFYMPRGNDGVQGVIEELRRKSWRRKEKMRTKGYNNSQVCCRFFDPISGENLGRRIKSDMLDLISGGLCEGYRLFCEVEAWVEKEGGGFTPRGLEQVKSNMSNPNSPVRGMKQSPMNNSGNVSGAVQNATPKSFGASLSPTNLIPPPGLTIPAANNDDDDHQCEVSAFWFLECFFPSSSMLCHWGKCYRPDIVLHPEQNWDSVELVRFANQEEAEAVLREEKNDVYLEEDFSGEGEEKKECPEHTLKAEKKRKKSKAKVNTGSRTSGNTSTSSPSPSPTQVTAAPVQASSNIMWKFVAFLSVFYSLYVNFGAGGSERAALMMKKKVKNLSTASQNVPLWLKNGESITLGSPPSETQTYQWSKDSVPLESETDSFLRLGGVNEDDEGVYSCEVKGDGVSADVLEVEIRISEPPEVKNNAGYYKVKEGHKFMLSVSSSGMPPPDFQWRLNGVEVEGANGATYLVDKISWGDAGTYTCSVGNAAGKVLWEEAVVDVVLDDEVEGDEL